MDVALNGSSTPRAEALIQQLLSIHVKGKLEKK
jgi:hypothetical protein